jgi:hypothetical protein
MAKRSQVGNINPTHYRSFTSFAGDIDLAAQSGCPPHEAERIEIVNANAAAQNIVLQAPVDPGGSPVSVAVTVSAASTRVFYAPVAKIVSAGTGTIASVTAFWWHSGGKINP